MTEEEDEDEAVESTQAKLKMLDDPEKCLKQIPERLAPKIRKIQLTNEFLNLGYAETDLGGLTAQEIIDKIQAFLFYKPNEFDCAIFLRFLAEHPVLMCATEVTPKFQKLIPCIYYAGEDLARTDGKDSWKVSMQNLSNWFVRSKSTILDYVKKNRGFQAGFERLDLEEAEGSSNDDLKDSSEKT